MFGLITQLTTAPQDRDTLVRILADATRDLPGCLGYVVALDAARDDAVWITEVWRDRNSHAASLTLPAVRDATMAARPLVTGIGARTETYPVSGA